MPRKFLDEHEREYAKRPVPTFVDYEAYLLSGLLHDHHLHLPGNQSTVCLCQHLILGTSLDVQGDRDNLQSDLTMFMEIGLL